MNRKRRWQSDRGAAAVEFALVLPLLLLLVFGIIDFGRMVVDQEQLTGAARTAAQAELVGASPDAAGRGVFAGARVGSATACPPDPDATATATVTLDYDFQFVTPLALFTGFTGSPTLSAKGTVLCRG